MALGQCLGAYGIEGFIKVRPHSGETAHFRHLITEKVTLKKESRVLNLTVENTKVHGPLVLIKFKGIDSPEAVTAYQSWELFADRKFAVPLKDSEFYISDLVSCDLVYNGQVLAKVINVWQNLDHYMFEVKTFDEKLVQVPFQAPFIGAVDIETKKIELLVDWILQ